MRSRALMRTALVRLLDGIYYLCIGWSAVAIGLMTLVIFWGVFTRYVLESGAMWSEPVSINMAIQVALYGGAACYRAGAHIRLGIFAAALPTPLARGVHLLVLALMGFFSLAILYYGAELVQTTMGQRYAELQIIPQGVVYLPIPISGAITFLFVVERFLCGPRWPTAEREAV